MGNIRLCSVTGCDKPVRTKGWCNMHYARWFRRGSLDRVTLDHSGKLCLIETCSNAAKYRGWCKKHYQRWQTHGDPEISLRGREGFKIQRGYKLIRNTEKGNAAGYIPEHRLVMGVHLGRDVLPTETVHHVNGIRDDNRIENLELWTSSQPAGQRVNDLRRWALELLSLYPKDV